MTADPCEVQPTDNTRQPQALQVKGGEHEALDAANYSPLGNADELVLDTLRDKAESLFDKQTAENYMKQALQTMATQSSPGASCEIAEDYKATALQEMAIQPLSAVLCSIPANARHYSP